MPKRRRSSPSKPVGQSTGTHDRDHCLGRPQRLRRRGYPPETGACLVLAGGVWWLREALLSGGPHTGSLSLVAPQLVAGIGMGMLIAPLFDFVLASVTDDEVGWSSWQQRRCCSR
jgi:hypothetical protein